VYIVLGGTGHTGSSVAGNLLQHGQCVTVITHDEQKAIAARRTGALVAVQDLRDVEALRNVLRTGERLFLLNPPASPSTDTDREERENVQAILAAIKGSGIKKIVAQSTYGAQAGSQLGDLSVLYEMEQALADQHVRTTIMRAAYLMSNWLMSLRTIREQGILPTFFPPEFSLPMVAPDDLGKVGAELLMQPVEETGMLHVEGPRRYTAIDVAQAFSQLFHKSVTVHTVPEQEWFTTYEGLGFSPEAARSYVGMTKATLEGSFPEATETRRGETSLTAYLANALPRSPQE
jgi:uncharacterized protein YbjT (DUF2867 family)